MLGLRLTSESHARVKNGQPAHSTTGVARASWIQSASRGSTAAVHGAGAIISAIAKAITGRPSAAATVKRRVMSISSTLGPSSSVTIAGSSAIPQNGQAPGPCCRTSGCIGQV